MRFAKHVLIAAAFVVCCTAAFAANAAADAVADAANAEVVLRAGHVQSAGSHWDFGPAKFAELVKAKTGGKVIVEVYPGGVLGQERDMIEAMQLNTLDIGLVSSAPLGGFLPAFMVLDLPYIFRDTEHLYKVIDGDLGKDLFKMLESQRIIGLSFMDNGFRNIASNGKAITKPSDLEGVKIRVMENEVHTTAFQRLGAIPVPMASGEVYTGLQQGTINAAENSICSIYSIKYQEIAKEISLTRHFAGAAPMIMSKAKYDSLKPEYQAILMEAAREACELQRKEVARLEVELIAEMKKLNCNFHDVDPVPFREIFLGVYPEFEHIIPQDFVKRILETK